MIIELNNGFYIEDGLFDDDKTFIEKNPLMFVYNPGGINGTIMPFMTGSQYLRYLLTIEDYKTISDFTHDRGRNVIWSGMIDKYYPRFLFEKILHYRKPLTEYDNKIHQELFKEESKYVLNMYFVDIFKSGYKDYSLKQNSYGLDLYQSVLSICKKLGTNELTIKSNNGLY